MAYAYTPLGGRNILTPEERVNQAIAAQNAMMANQAARYNTAAQAGVNTADILRNDQFARQVAAGQAASARAQAEAAQAQMARDFAMQMQERKWGREDVREKRAEAKRAAALEALGIGPAAEGAQPAAAPGLAPQGADATAGMAPELAAAARVLAATGADVGSIGGMIAKETLGEARGQRERSAQAVARAIEAAREAGDPEQAMRLASYADDGKIDPSEAAQARTYERKQVTKTAATARAQEARAALKQRLRAFLDNDYSFGAFDPSDADADKLMELLKTIARESKAAGMSPEKVSQAIREAIEEAGGIGPYYTESPSGDMARNLRDRIRKVFNVGV